MLCYVMQSGETTRSIVRYRPLCFRNTFSSVHASSMFVEFVVRCITCEAKSSLPCRDSLHFVVRIGNLKHTVTYFFNLNKKR